MQRFFAFTVKAFFEKELSEKLEGSTNSAASRPVPVSLSTYQL